ncbi:MAG: hypothetical protein RL546_91, partial [Chloroflexota bacterium]
RNAPAPPEVEQDALIPLRQISDADARAWVREEYFVLYGDGSADEVTRWLAAYKRERNDECKREDSIPHCTTTSPTMFGWTVQTNE